MNAEPEATAAPHPQFGELVWEYRRTGFPYYAGFFGSGAAAIGSLILGALLGVACIHALLALTDIFLAVASFTFSLAAFWFGVITAKKMSRRAKLGPFCISFYEQGMDLDLLHNRHAIQYSALTTFALKAMVHRSRGYSLAEVVLGFTIPSGQHFDLSSIEVTSRALKTRGELPFGPIEQITMHPVPAAVAIARNRVSPILADLASGRAMDIQIKVPWALTARDGVLDSQSIRIMPNRDEIVRHLPLASHRFLHIRLAERHGASLGMKERNGWKDFEVLPAQPGETDGLTQLLALQKLLSLAADDDQPEALGRQSPGVDLDGARAQGPDQGDERWPSGTP